MRYAQRINSIVWFTVILAACLQFCGCSSVTNPVANGVPARLLPPELLAESKEEMRDIPLAWLRVKPPEVYKLDTGDIVGVYIEGALGERDQIPPINFPQVADQPPSMGFPIPVGENGTISLPLVKEVDVRGLSLDEARDAIIEAYTAGPKKYLREDEARVIVSLVRPRTARILVIRQDEPTQRVSLNDPTYRLFGSAPTLGTEAQGTGNVLELPETEADVLTVLARTGGPPGPAGANEVVIYRGFSDLAGFDVPPDWNADRFDSGSSVSDSDEAETIHIPMRVRPGDPPPFEPHDIHLKTGDIVFIPSRDTDVYYTGGLMPAREAPLPRDYDLRVVEAVLRVGGPVVNGGVLVGSFAAPTAFAQGIGNPSPSLLTVLRKTPQGHQVPIRVNLNRALRDPRENLMIMPGDILLLQETPAEAVNRYLTDIVSLQIFVELFRGSSGVGTFNAIGPQ